MIASVIAEASAQANVATSLALLANPRNLTSILHRMQAMICTFTDTQSESHVRHNTGAHFGFAHQMDSGSDWHGRIRQQHALFQQGGPLFPSYILSPEGSMAAA